MKPIVLCADDYGITPTVGAGIRELAASRRLSAVTCMSSTPIWTTEAKLLQPLQDKIDVGFHFNLTLDLGYSSVKNLPVWIISGLSGRINQDLVEREFLQQLERFEFCWGKPPAFIDGHQHVHIFPGIRRPLLRLLARRYPEAERPWLRRINPLLTGHDAPIKALMLKMLSIGLTRDSRQAGLLLSDNFAGLYSLTATADFPAMMSGWLRQSQPGTVVMCHPSISAAQTPDGNGPARKREFQYLRSREFIRVCENEGVVLTSFSTWQQELDKARTITCHKRHKM